jgi:hypothetical protein
MNRYYQSMRYMAALGIAFPVVILIFITLIRHVPMLVEAMGISPSQPLKEFSMWSVIAEMVFLWAILVGLYGLVSLWLPELRFILWFGMGLAVLAGMLYLIAGVMYYQRQGMGAPFQQGAFMFLFSLILPFLAFKLLERVNRWKESHPPLHRRWVSRTEESNTSSSIYPL